MDINLNKKNISIIALIIIAVITSQFIYKDYAVGLQTTKELKVIEAQRNANTLKMEQGQIADDKKERERQLNIDFCIDDAYDNYKADWDSACKIIGKKDDCSLYSDRSDKLNDRHEDNKNNCYKRYAK